MDVNVITNSISQVGFPIVCVLGLSYFIYKIWISMSKQQENLTKTLINVNDTNKALSETNKELSETNKALVGSIAKDIEVIKSKIN